MDKVPYTGISRYRRTNRQIWGIRRSLLFALNATFEFRQRNALRSADEEEIGIGKANEARAHQSVIQTRCAAASDLSSQFAGTGEESKGVRTRRLQPAFFLDAPSASLDCSPN